MSGTRPSLGRALAIPRYVLATLEFATTFATLTLVYGFGPRLREVCIVSLIPVALLFLGRRLYEDRRRVRPIAQLALKGLAGTLDAAGRDALAEALVALPRRIVLTRFAVWAVTAGVIVTVMSRISGLQWQDIFAIAGICLGVSVVFLMWRAQWLRRVAEHVLLPALPGADVGRYLGRTIRERLFIAAYLPIAVGAILAGLYDWLFLALPPYSLRGLFMGVPPLALLLTLTFAAVLIRWTEPLRAHLAGRPLHGAHDGPWKLRDSTPDPGPREALRVATALPYRAATLSLALWAGCAAFVGILRTVKYGPWQEGVILFAGLMAVGLLAALLQVAWSRVSLQPAREVCARELGLVPLAELWPQIRIRDRVVAAVLAVLFASSTFTFTTLYLQQREIMGHTWRASEGVYGIRGLTLLFAILGLVAFIIALVAANDITGPLESLRRFARGLGRGELDSHLPVPDADEVGELGLTLDKMRVDLRAQIQAVTELNQSLEQKVAERTAELRAAQAQLVHGEKMASVGRLAAGVAHEINNPLNFIANALGPMESTLRDVQAVMALEGKGEPDAARREGERRQLGTSLQELDDLIRVMRNGIQRTQQIVRGLRDFSRSDESDELKETDVGVLCNETIALLRHELGERIEIVRRYDSDSRVMCYPGATGQLLMNLIANAAQSIPGYGRIEVATRRTGDAFELTVSDSGTGIAPEALPRIFDPFFTTKEPGKGSGLGLSIVHGIVERHGGRIDVESKVGTGTTFRVSLPASAALAKAS